MGMEISIIVMHHLPSDDCLQTAQIHVHIIIHAFVHRSISDKPFYLSSIQKSSPTDMHTGLQMQGNLTSQSIDAAKV